VRNWEFLQGGLAPLPELGGEINPLKLLRRRTSLVVDDLPTSPLAMHVQQQQQPNAKAAPPPVFVEPDASALLDSFGF
jgi:hypothetical protein